MITRPEVVRRSLVNKVLREENTTPRRQLAELRAELEAVEWVEDHKEKGLFYCPRCGGEMGMGHYDGCQLAAALARAEAPGSEKEAG